MANKVTPVNADGTPNGFSATAGTSGGNLVTLVDDNGQPIAIGGGGGTGSGVSSVNTQVGDVVGTYKTVGNLQKQFDDIDTDVSANTTDITSNTTSISDLTTQVGTNTTNIATNTTDITTIENSYVSTVNGQPGTIVGTYKVNGNLQKQFNDIKTDIEAIPAPQTYAVSQFVATTPAPLAITANTNIDISNLITSGTFVETQVGTDVHVFGDTIKKSIKPNKTGWYQLNIIFTLTGGALNDFNASLKLFSSTNGTTWATELPFCFRNQGLTTDTTTQGAGNVTLSTQFYFNQTGTNGANILAHGVKAIAQISDSGTATDLKLQIGRV